MRSDEELIDGLRSGLGDTPATRGDLIDCLRERAAAEPATRSAVSDCRHSSAMAPQPRRGGCDGVCGRRAGCRRWRSGPAQRPSPAGSAARRRFPQTTRGLRPATFTARVAAALAERLAE